MKPWDDRLEALEDLLSRLIEENERYPVIVEGRKDRESLRSLGLTKKIIALNQGRSIMGVCEEIGKSEERVIILTDWDKKGGSLTVLLKEGLRANGVRFDDRIRGELAVLTRRDIKDVESLHTLMLRLRKEKVAAQSTGRGL